MSTDRKNWGWGRSGIDSDKKEGPSLTLATRAYFFFFNLYFMWLKARVERTQISRVENKMKMPTQTLLSYCKTTVLSSCHKDFQDRAHAVTHSGFLETSQMFSESAATQSALCCKCTENLASVGSWPAPVPNRFPSCYRLLSVVREENMLWWGAKSAGFELATTLGPVPQLCCPSDALISINLQGKLRE